MRNGTMPGVTHKQKTRGRIIKTAAEAMRVQGIQSISVANLMKQAGLTHGGLYAYFASRDDLVVNAVDEMFEDSRSLIEIIISNADLKQGVARFIESYLADEVRNLPEKGCPLPTLAAEAIRMPAGARSRFDRGVEYFQQKLTEALELLGEPQPANLASSVISELAGAMALARAATDQGKSDQIFRSSRHLIKKRLGLL